MAFTSREQGIETGKPSRNVALNLMNNTFLVLIAASLSMVSACGDDAAESSSKTPARRARRAAQKQAAPAVTTFSYPKVSKKLRRKLTEIDFIPDGSGETNRDPFRSWTLKPREPIAEDQVEPDDLCESGKVRWGAREYSIRDLVLRGLVKFGRSYAQFSDQTETDAWIVRKGDCLGKEKAILEEVGVGFVTLTVIPPAPPGARAPRPQRQSIQLNPDELKLPSQILNSFEDSGSHSN